MRRWYQSRILNKIRSIPNDQSTHGQGHKNQKQDIAILDICILYTYYVFIRLLDYGILYLPVVE